MEAPKTNTNSSDSTLHFLDYWRIIRIRKTVILAVFLLVVLTTTAVTFVLPVSYMSKVRIAVEKDSSDIMGLLGLPSQSTFDPYFIQTEFEKIQSQKVLDEVINSLNLNEVWSRRYGATENLKTTETRRILQNQIDVSQARNTSLIEIRVFSEEAKEAADIANKIADVYRTNRIEALRAQSSQGIAALKQMLTERDEQIRELQAKVDELRRDLKISDVDTGMGIVGSTIEPETVRFLEQERVKAEQMRILWQTLLTQMEGLDKHELREALPTAQPDQQLNKLLADYSEARQRYAALIKDYSDNHPEVQRVTSLIKEIDDQIERRVNGIMEGVKAMVAQHTKNCEVLQQQVDQAKSRDAENLEKYRPYFNLRRQLETAQKIRENIFFRIIQETVDMELPKSSIVEITDRAEPGQRPVRPNVPLNIALGVIVGLVMGIGLAFFIEYLDTSVKTIDDVERALQAPVLGVIPQNVGSLLAEGPDSPHAEAYRVLRTNILFSRKKPDMKTITVVSGGAGEGKSTTIFNLATVFAQSGSRVLVVDSDLRRPSLHKFLNVSNSLGLTNYLLKQHDLEKVIQTTQLPSLHFLPSGKLPSSSLGVLNSARMKEFIHEVKGRYDFVFFDSPPIMGVSDASILASEIDIALLVVQYRKYPQVMTVRAKQMVEKVGGNMLGVVLNNINISQDSYYYYYSGYYYDYYSKHDDSGTPAVKNGEAQKDSGDAGGNRLAGGELKKKY